MLSIGRKYGYIVLTENLGAFALTRLDERFRMVKVWRSLEVLVEAYRLGVVKGDIRTASKLAGINVDEFASIAKKANIPSGP